MVLLPVLAWPRVLPAVRAQARKRPFHGGPGGVRSRDAAALRPPASWLLSLTPQVKNKMTLESFLRNLRGVNEGEDFDRQFLEVGSWAGGADGTGVRVGHTVEEGGMGRALARASLYDVRLGRRAGRRAV